MSSIRMLQDALQCALDFCANGISHRQSHFAGNDRLIATFSFSGL